MQSNTVVVYTTRNDKNAIKIFQGISIVQLVLVCLQFNHR